MDADGNGTVDYDELEAFILGDEQQDSESISGALQFALRRKLLAVQAKDLMNRLGFAAKKASKGNVHVKTSFTTGSTFPVPGSAGPRSAGSAAEGNEAPPGPAVDPPFKLHLQVGAEGAIASVKDLGAEEGETEAIQLVFGVGDAVTAEGVHLIQRILDELLSKGRLIMEMMEEPMPVSRLQLEGPVPSPVAGTTGNAIVLSLYLNANLAAMLAENIDLDDMLDSDLLESDDDSDSVAGSEGSDASESDFEGRKLKTRHVHEVVKRILHKLEVVVQANHSLEELMAGSHCEEGGSLDVQTSVDVKISKAMLQLLRTMVQLGAYRSRSNARQAANNMMILAPLAALNSLESHLHFDADRLFNLTAAAGLGEDRPGSADLSPARLLTVLVEGYLFQGLLENLDLDEPPAVGMDMLAQVLAGATESSSDLPVPVSAPSEEMLSQLASGGDEEELQGVMMGAGYGMFKWFNDSVVDIRSVRAAGAGLGLHLQAKGFNTRYLATALSTAHETRKALVAQAAKERAVPGLLVLACNPQYSAAVRGSTTEKGDSSYGAPDYHISSDHLKNFNEQFQMTLRGIGAVDHCDIFEHVREEDGGELVEAFQEGPEAFHAKAAETLKRPLVLPPSGVRGPFGALLVLPASAFSADVAEFGITADPTASSEVATAKAYIAAVQSRVTELNELFPTQPSEAMWTVAIDCHGGKVFPGLGDAVRSVLHLPEAQVAVADFGSSLGVTSALSTAVQPVLKACSTPEYIALRAEDGLQLPESE